MCLSSARYVPRAPLPTSGVTFCSVPSSSTSEGITLPSSLLWAHEPDQNPLPSFGYEPRQEVLTGCCQPLMEDGLSRCYLRTPCMGARTRTPQCLSSAHTRFFLGKLRSHPIRERFDTPNTRRNATSTTGQISGLQSFLYVPAPILARPPGCTYR